MIIRQNRSGLICSGIAAIVAAYALLLVQPAWGIEMEALYTVEVPFDPQEADARSEAYDRAINEVLIRITGSESTFEEDDIQRLFPNPARYVLQFRRGDGENLVVSLDGPAIEQVLRNAGESVWGSDRPLTLVWLAVDWGGGEREIIGADDPETSLGATRSIDRYRLLRERVKSVAQRRGIPVVFPLVDTEDLASLSFSDIWGGFDAPLIEASRRYGSTSILVGRIRAEELIGDRWTFYFGGQERQWNGSPEMAVNELADVIASQFAYRGDAPVETVALSISGLDSVIAYGSVQRFLSNLSVIDSYTIDTVTGSEILFKVRVQGGRDRLAAALEFSGILERNNWLDLGGSFGGSAVDESLEFEYRPYLPDAIDAEDPSSTFEPVDARGSLR